jgi:hypothetical protein
MPTKSELAILHRYFLAGEREAHFLGIDIEVEITKIHDKIIAKKQSIEEKQVMTSSISAFVQAAITIVKDDALTGALPVLNGFFTNIQANPSTANLTAQSAALEVALLAALPNIEGQVIKDMAALVQSQIDALIAQNVTPVEPPAPAPAA